MGKQKRARPTSDSSSHKKSKIDGNANADGSVCDPALKNCAVILGKLMKHKYAWIFNEPVDVQCLGLYDYYSVIREPMDLGTIKTRLDRNRYSSPAEFAHDVRLTFRNAMTYNDRAHEVHIIARQLLNMFEKQWSAVKARLAKSSRPPAAAAAAAEVQTATAGEVQKSDEMTFEQKYTLMNNLEILLSEKLESIVEIIRKRNPQLVQNNEQIEVDLDVMDTETLWELERLVVDCNKSLTKERKVASEESSQ
ncbi:transcription factor GTE3, chloroplastic-like [Typha angustifolia]|uniref:transcription factor GTE3, chloroplastic-like n=1 Tax=Typha angustifolia TaxID=59011 RepID=UPI003C2C4FB6